MIKNFDDFLNENDTPNHLKELTEYLKIASKRDISLVIMRSPGTGVLHTIRTQLKAENRKEVIASMATLNDIRKLVSLLEENAKDCTIILDEFEKTPDRLLPDVLNLVKACVDVTSGYTSGTNTVKFKSVDKDASFEFESNIFILSTSHVAKELEARCAIIDTTK